jgi:hypothetical protein
MYIDIYIHIPIHSKIGEEYDFGECLVDDGIMTIGTDMEKYDEDDLDVLALAFTAVKLAYLRGIPYKYLYIYTYVHIFVFCMYLYT